MEKSYFLEVKAFPLSDGNIQMSGFSSSSLAALMGKLNGDASPLRKLRNLSELSERINFELDRFKDHGGGGPPAFQEYLKNLRAMHALIKIAESSHGPIANGFQAEVDYSSPQFTLKREKFPKVRDFSAAMQKIKEGFDSEIDDFAHGNLSNVGEVFVLHIQLLAEFARIDLVQHEDEDSSISCVEVSYCKDGQKQDSKEIPLVPNHFQIEISNLETYVVYEKTKDAVAAIASKYSDGTVRFPPITEDKTIRQRVIEICDLETRILEKKITYKDIGDFGWYTVRAYTSKPGVIWSIPASKIDARLEALGKASARAELSPGLGERKKSFLFRKKPSDKGFKA